MGSQVDTLLAADDFTQFSDRLEFMGAIAQNDADLATLAAAAEQQAQWAADQYRKVVSDRRAKLAEMASTRDQIQSMLAEQQAELDQTRRDYADWQAFLEAQREQAAAAAAAEEAASNDTGGGTGGATGGDTGGGAGGGYVPPPNLTGAAAAVAAARSVLGTQYVWGAADPSVGFDCSGLTSWAWAQGGVYIPHSSASQYSSLPHVPSMAQAQPGDLLFFYSPISHVALYIGGGMMIHARHPGPGGQVQIGSVSGYGTPVVGIARPG
jgi:cell wall-associated NlpC family hydrolase